MARPSCLRRTNRNPDGEPPHLRLSSFYETPRTALNLPGEGCSITREGLEGARRRCACAVFFVVTFALTSRELQLGLTYSY